MGPSPAEPLADYPVTTARSSVTVTLAVVVVVIAGSVPENPPPLQEMSQAATARSVNSPSGSLAEVVV